MERKIGEISEFGGEWYQCMKGNICNDCAFYRSSCGSLTGKGNCRYDFRGDATNVIFKKLEKVGEPYTLENKKFQKYRVFHTPYIYNKIDCSWQSFADPYYIGLEVKQNKKEIMYIHKVAMNICDRDYLLDKLESILHDTHCQQYKDEICKAFLKYIATENDSDLKLFDLNAAKVGKPVCTRDRRKARIICFDAKFPKTGNIVTLVEKENGEEVILYHYDDGHCSIGRGYDLMMSTEKKEGWINIYKGGLLDTKSYSSKEEAVSKASRVDYIDTIKIEWEE